MFIPLFRNPFLAFNTDGDDGGGGDKSNSEELGFPADTKPEDMSPEEQAAYWKNDSEKWKTLSRKHEKNRKPKTFDEDMAELEQLRSKQDDGLKPDAKAVKDAERAARAAGRDEGISQLLTAAVRAEFKARAPHLTEEELTEFLEDIEVTAEKFYDDGDLNTDRIDRLAKRIAKPDAEDEDAAPKHRFNLGDVTSRDSRKQKKGSGNPRQAAYERVKAKYQKPASN